MILSKMKAFIANLNDLLDYAVNWKQLALLLTIATISTAVVGSWNAQIGMRVMYLALILFGGGLSVILTAAFLIQRSRKTCN
jgi:hypothetical protein